MPGLDPGIQTFSDSGQKRGMENIIPTFLVSRRILYLYFSLFSYFITIMTASPILHDRIRCPACRALK